MGHSRAFPFVFQKFKYLFGKCFRGLGERESLTEIDIKSASASRSSDDRLPVTERLNCLNRKTGAELNGVNDHSSICVNSGERLLGPQYQCSNRPSSFTAYRASKSQLGVWSSFLDPRKNLFQEPLQSMYVYRIYGPDKKNASSSRVWQRTKVRVEEMAHAKYFA